MKEHEESDYQQFALLNATLKRIEDKLDPMVEVYQTAGKLWKWAMGVALLVSLITGSIWAVVQTLHTVK